MREYRRRSVVVLSTMALVSVSLLSATATAAPGDSGDRLDVYTGTISVAQVADLVALGIDRH